MHVRVCRECGEEYRPEIAACADCGGILDDRYLGEDVEGGAAVVSGPPEPSPPEPPVLKGEPRRLLSASAAEIEPSARSLGEAGIPFLVRPGWGGFDLLVGEEDFEAAARALGLVREAPEAAPDTHCPACGAGLVPGQGECRECGLAAGEEAEEPAACPRCRAPLSDQRAACSSCGYEAPG